MKKKSITAKEFEEKFDNGEDISEYVDWSTAIRPNKKVQRVNVDFTTWMVRRLDAEAARLGVTRQSVIKMWIGDRLDALDERQSKEA